MLSILYDSTFEGFLSVVFEVYRQHLDVGDIVPDRPYDSVSSKTADLFMQPFRIETSEESAKRLTRAIVNKAGEDVFNLLQTAFRSEEPLVEMNILAYLRKLFAAESPDYAKNPASEEMLPLLKTAQAVRREAGNMLGMVRFDKTQDGMYISEIEPKYNIVDMIVGHFRGRFPNGRWAIVDVLRGYGAYYDGKHTQMVEVPNPAELSKKIAAEASSDEFTKMWKSYYDSMAIKERLNPALLKRCLPVRYWKHLPERRQNLSDVTIGSGRGEARGDLGFGSSSLPSVVAQRNARFAALGKS
ncbi:MAG: TIGR03915 family putative DNA repair protein [Fibrobacter sp.]|nr:TIGR03915 family putative DNA repair protein [Fibrobacter sp.]